MSKPSDEAVRKEFERLVDEFVMAHPPNWHHRCPDHAKAIEYAAWSECELRRLLLEFGKASRSAAIQECAKVAEAERGQPEYEHDDIAVMYGKKIAAALLALKER